ncbi:MAG: ATP-binding protein [Micrococcales bacterium]|nr:ATP-binding protein [Micrococcales bacterium]
MTGDDVPEDKSYVLKGLASPDQLDNVHDLLEQAAGEHPSINPMDVKLFETAILELANNVIQYGRPVGKVQWEVTIRVSHDHIEADLDDTGQSFVPTEGSAMPDEDAEGGRGLAIAKAVVDQMEYQRIGDKNHWHMVRLLGHIPPG